MFKLSDIKPGYLLRLYDSDKNVNFFVTVLPCSAYKFQTIIGAILASAIGTPKDGDLALGGDDFYSTLGCFDDNLTDRLAQSCQIMNIKLIDHVIITDGEYYSYSDEGKI